MQQTVLITGVNGQVGHALAHAFTNQTYLNQPFLDQSYLFDTKEDLAQDGSPLCPSKTVKFQVVQLNRAALDLTNVDAIRSAVQAIQPDIIINPAAYTAVDKAETEVALAYAINAIAPRVLAEEAAKCHARLIHFSTDYVFDGTKHTAYCETDATGPLSVYGESKLAGELAIQAVDVQHLIFRTSWVYGAIGHNFLKTILRLSQTKPSLNIVADQFGSPTSSESIANATIQAILNWQSQSGVYHMVNAGDTTWHGFAQEIVTQYCEAKRMPPLTLQPSDILPITTAQYPTPAKRPVNSRLNTARLAQDFGLRLGVWQKALSQVLQALD